MSDAEAVPAMWAGVLDGDAVKTLLDALQAADAEAIFHAAHDELRAECVDGGRVLMVRASVPGDAWESYEAGGIKIGYALERLESYATIGDTAEFTWDTDDRKLEIASGPASASMGGIAPGDIRSQEISDDVEDGLAATFDVDGDDLAQAIRVTSKSSGESAVELCAPADGQPFFRFVGDTDTVVMDLESADVLDAPDTDQRVLVSAQYLSNVAGALPKDATATVRMASDYPVLIDYDHAGVTVRFLVAPRIETR